MSRPNAATDTRQNSSAAEAEAPDDSMAIISRSQMPKDSAINLEKCRCLENMLSLLEEIGCQRVSIEFAGIDNLLVCLEGGIQTCNTTLACSRCDSWSDNPMLLASISQQLGSICSDLWHVFIEKQRRSFNTCQSAEAFDEVLRHEILQGAVAFGRYQVKSPEKRLQLIGNVITLHLGDLKRFLARLSDHLGQRRAASALIKEATETVNTIFQKAQNFGKS